MTERTCGYGGHSHMPRHAATVLMRSPQGRRCWCCRAAEEFALRRGWVRTECCADISKEPDHAPH